VPKKLESLDSIDVKILEGLGTCGPRNLTKIARKLGLNTEMVRSRLEHLSSLFYLRTSANVYHTNLGLKKAVVFAEAAPGHEELLFNCLKVNSFHIYLTRCYGIFEGCFGIYTIPKDRCTEFEKFIGEIEKLGVAINVQVFWSTCFHTVNRTSNWFDHEAQIWVFPWDDWVKEILTEQTKLPYTLVDPRDFPMKADEIDLFILKELEKNATISLRDIAKMLGITPQRAQYHFKTHLIERGLIEDFQIFIFPFERTISDMFWFLVKFDSKDNMAKFARSLLDKPFVYVLGKVLGESALITQIYLPKLEFRRFIDALSTLSRNGFLQSYDYVIQDLRKDRWSRETIPFEDFKDGSWIYDHQKHVKNLRNLVKETAPQIHISEKNHLRSA
jgi:DNA-binding Lrp family transcriptional regulator